MHFWIVRRLSRGTTTTRMGITSGEWAWEGRDDLGLGHGEMKVPVACPVDD